MSAPSARLSIQAVSPAYWRVTIGNPPINLYDPEMFAELRVLYERAEADPALKVLVFDSADPDYFIAHYDTVRGGEIPDMPGAAPFTEWPALVTQMAASRVISIAAIRGRTRGHGSEFALACDMRFASLEKAVFGQIEVGLGVVPGGGAMDWLPQLAGRSRALEIILGAQDFDASLAERYGWINRALPDADLDAFVEDLASRIAHFDAKALETVKATINARAGFPSDADRRASNLAFLASTTWPGVAPRAALARERGLQVPGDFERDLGIHLRALNDDHNAKAGA
jgi:enoyl-CoA hydratase/carnithine racemase